MSVPYESFGKYVLLEKLATGGMAEVFLARGTGAGGIGKFFAIKRILPQYADSQEFIDMFKAEAKIAINLSHSNIVSIHEFGVEKGQFFLVMDYVEGRNLRQILNKMKKTSKQFSIDQVVYMIKEVSSGLDHAHRCIDGSTGRPLNITHRDMSPQNVMVSFEGEVKIVDFGIAKAESEIETTRAGTLKGKFGYMSPEQAEGQPVDLRTDIFSLGIVLWELLAQDRLFVANNEINTLRKIRDCQIPSLRKINPNIHAELERIVQKALARDRNLRYQTGAALQRDLNRFLNRQFPDFSAQDFSVFTKEVFADEILSLRKRLVEYTKLNLGSNRTHRNPRDEEEDSTALLQTGSHSVMVTESGVDHDSSASKVIHQLRKDDTGSSEVTSTTQSDSEISVPDMTTPSGDAPVSEEATEAMNKNGVSSTALTTIPVVKPAPEPTPTDLPANLKLDPTRKKKTTLLDHAALNSDINQNLEQLESAPKNARGPGPQDSLGLGGNLETEDVTSPSYVIRRPTPNAPKKNNEAVRTRPNKASTPARMATTMVFALMCLSAYCYLVKYLTPTMAPVIAMTDPVMGPVHDWLGVPRTDRTPSGQITINDALPQRPQPHVAKPVDGGIVVTSNPSGAEIDINGQNTGLSTPNRVEVPTQTTFSITVRKRGYHDYKRTEITKESMGHRLDVDLQKMNVGYLDIEIFPPQDAVLFVGGKRVELYRNAAREIMIQGNTQVYVRAESRTSTTFDESTVTIGTDRHTRVQLNPRKLQRQPATTVLPSSK